MSRALGWPADVNGNRLACRRSAPPPIYVPAAELEAIINRWAPDTDPASHFRFALCADCGKPIQGPMYHCWLPDRCREIHLCRECGSKWPTTP